MNLGDVASFLQKHSQYNLTMTWCLRGARFVVQITRPTSYGGHRIHEGIDGSLHGAVAECISDFISDIQECVS